MANWWDEDVKWSGIGHGLSTLSGDALKWASLYGTKLPDTPSDHYSSARADRMMKAAAKAGAGGAGEKGGKGPYLDQNPVEWLARESEREGGRQGQLTIDQQRVRAALAASGDVGGDTELFDSPIEAAQASPEETDYRRKVARLKALRGDAGAYGRAKEQADLENLTRQRKGTQKILMDENLLFRRPIEVKPDVEGQMTPEQREEFAALVQRMIDEEGRKKHARDNPDTSRGDYAAAQVQRLDSEAEAGRKNARDVAGISAGPNYMREGRENREENRDIVAQGDNPALDEYNARKQARRNSILSHPSMIGAPEDLRRQVAERSDSDFERFNGAPPAALPTSAATFRKEHGPVKPPQPARMSDEQKATLKAAERVYIEKQKALNMAQSSVSKERSAVGKADESKLVPLKDEADRALQNYLNLSGGIPPSGAGAPAQGGVAAPPPASTTPATGSADAELEAYRTALNDPTLTREQLDAAKRGK